MAAINEESVVCGCTFSRSLARDESVSTYVSAAA